MTHTEEPEKEKRQGKKEKRKGRERDGQLRSESQTGKQGRRNKVGSRTGESGRRHEERRQPRFRSIMETGMRERS